MRTHIMPCPDCGGFSPYSAQRSLDICMHCGMVVKVEPTMFSIKLSLLTPSGYQELSPTEKAWVNDLFKQYLNKLTPSEE